MQDITVILVLLLAVLVSQIVARLSPIDLPLPILQILVGAMLSYFIGFELKLNPELFFLLFVPPLLFLDGWRISKRALFTNWRPILTLAFGLVVFTVVGVGLLIDWLVPAMPLAVAFAVAAILSPTDPVAVSSITQGTPIPSRLMQILEGEALLNDASGLVCFRFAVAAMLTGSFSLPRASLSLLLTASGGLLAGAAVSWGATATYHQVSKQVGEEPGSQILISILIPFAAYLVAEYLRASGILAAAAAGVVIHYADLKTRMLGLTRMQRSAVWDMLQMALNGTMFVLLGEQLPGIFANMLSTTTHLGANSSGKLIFYVVVIVLALATMRFIWIWASLLAARLLVMRRDGTRERPRLRFLLVATLAGVKGTITLAGILTLPLVMPDGSAFPARDLAIFLAASAILLSLVLASAGLPALARGLQYAEQLPSSDPESDARSAAAQAAIKRLKQMRGQLAGEDANIEAEAADFVIARYQTRLDDLSDNEDEMKRIKLVNKAEHRLLLAALRAERDEYYRLRLAHEIDDPLHRRLVRRIDLMEASLLPHNSV